MRSSTLFLAVLGLVGAGCDPRECVNYNDCGAGAYCTADYSCAPLPLDEDSSQQATGPVGQGVPRAPGELTSDDDAFAGLVVSVATITGTVDGLDVNVPLGSVELDTSIGWLSVAGGEGPEAGMMFFQFATPDELVALLDAGTLPAAPPFAGGCLHLTDDGWAIDVVGDPDITVAVDDEGVVSLSSTTSFWGSGTEGELHLDLVLTP